MREAIVLALGTAGALGGAAYVQAHPEHKAPVVVGLLLIIALGWYLATQGI